MKLSRRDFVRLAVVGGAGIAAAAAEPQTRARLSFGVCAGFEKAAELKDIGFDFIEGGVAGYLKPDMPDAEYGPEIEKLKKSVLPIRSLSGFIPGRFRLTGPDPMLDSALEYAVKACRRADEIGIPFIVLGSGVARRVPAGFDLEKGKGQFITFCKRLGDRIGNSKVTIVLEPLNSAETNILNRVDEGVEYVDAIGCPRIQLLADIFHMRKEKESQDSIRRAGARLKHCHISELEGRKAPGSNGDDMRDYFKALHDIGYQGGVSCECGWPKTDSGKVWKLALATLRSQAG